MEDRNEDIIEEMEDGGEKDGERVPEQCWRDQWS